MLVVYATTLDGAPDPRSTGFADSEELLNIQRVLPVAGSASVAWPWRAVKGPFVSDPKGRVIVGAGNAVEAVRCPVRSFASPVESFDQLLHRTEFRGNRIGVDNADNLCDLKLHPITEFAEELLGSKWIGTVTVGDEPEPFREVVFQLLESLAYCLDTGTNRTVHRSCIADDGTADRVHDEPDVGLHAADFDVGLIRNKDVDWMIIVMIYEGFHTDGGCLTVIRGLLA